MNQEDRQRIGQLVDNLEDIREQIEVYAVKQRKDEDRQRGMLTLIGDDAATLANAAEDLRRCIERLEAL